MILPELYFHAHLHHRRDWHVIALLTASHCGCALPTAVLSFILRTYLLQEQLEPVITQAIYINTVFFTNTKQKTREWLPAAQRLFNSVFLGSALQLSSPAVRRPHGSEKAPRQSDLRGTPTEPLPAGM
ncbi:hypothetical protein HDV57DRAFT_282178 [Trichoderma longibrachiatum]|uniref:Uncharacterized protein n=1 Tax=Trichoderma longibrachiatum ATCC 18648 TaxID=983965 RepID=A0A2T4CDJ5_TRILO|nr:hypothetical protein M440DRAFT_1176347 [Trichoderma longibrachiatum ATCC 18648]